MDCSESIIEFYNYINREENKHLAYSKGILKGLVEKIMRNENITTNTKEEDNV